MLNAAYLGVRFRKGSSEEELAFVNTLEFVTWFFGVIPIALLVLRAYVFLPKNILKKNSKSDYVYTWMFVLMIIIWASFRLYWSHIK